MSTLVLTFNTWFLPATLGATPAADPNRKESGHCYAQPVSTIGADAGHRPDAHGTGLRGVPRVGTVLLRAEQPVPSACVQDIRVAH